MRVQWQIIDVDTKQSLLIEDEFEIVDELRKIFDGNKINYETACIIFGHPSSLKNPTGFLKIFKNEIKK